MPGRSRSTRRYLDIETKLMSSGSSTRSLSGKRMTIVLMLILLSTGGLFYWVTTAYSVYNAARRQTDRDWRELATLLETRYRELDQRITEANPSVVDPQLRDDWKAARDQFQGTGISRLQIDSAEKVEAIVARLPESLATTPSAELAGARAKYDQSAQQQRAIGQTAGSKLLKVMLNLPDPKDFALP